MYLIYIYINESSYFVYHLTLPVKCGTQTFIKNLINKKLENMNLKLNLLPFSLKM